MKSGRSQLLERRIDSCREFEFYHNQDGKSVEAFPFVLMSPWWFGCFSPERTKGGDAIIGGCAGQLRFIKKTLIY